jgi:outer membrane protein
MNRITLLTLVTLLTFAQLGAGMTLAEAVAIGKKRSLAQVKPQLDQDRVKGQVIEAWSNALPQVEGTVGYQRAIKPTKFFFPDESGNLQAIEIGADNAIQADVTLNQPLLTFGRVAAGLRGAYAAKRANEHMITQNTRNVEYEVMTRFWSVLLLRDVVKAREASLSISDSSLTRAQLMKEVGLMSDYDVLRVRVQAENQKPQLQDAQKNLRLAELSLKEYLGVPLDTTITFDGSLEDFHFEVDSSDVQKQIQSRDDLEALRHLSDMQKNIYVIFRNAHWPTLGGQLKYSWQWQNNEWTSIRATTCRRFMRVWG